MGFLLSGFLLGVSPVMAVKDIKPVTSGGYDFTVNFRRGKNPMVAENGKTIRLTEPNSGIVVFENGLIVLWQTKSSDAGPGRLDFCRGSTDRWRVTQHRDKE